MNRYKGFVDDFNRLNPKAFIEIDGELHLCVAQNGGFVLYDRSEWNAACTADHEADADGKVMRLGRYTGQTLPISVTATALPN